jgi:uncharacterized protein YkwD
MKKRTLLLLLFISIYSTTFSQKIRFVNEKWEELDQNLLLKEFQKQYDHIRDSFGLSRLKFNTTCDSVAKGHAIYMATTGDYQHGQGSLNFAQKIDKILGRKPKGLNQELFCENIIKISSVSWTKKSRDNIPFEYIEKQIGNFHASKFLGKDIYYQDLVKCIIEGWMDSPGHRHNLLDENHSEFSIACKTSLDNHFYACFNAF